MYASVYCESAPALILKDIAGQFSPLFEVIDQQTIVFDVAGNAHLIGTPNDIAATIDATARRAGLTSVNIAVAHSPDAAVCVARFIDGLTVIPPGRESEYLSPIPIEALQTSLCRRKNDPLWIEVAQIIDTLHRWGIRSFGELTALSDDDVAARLGAEGVRLHKFA